MCGVILVSSLLLLGRGREEKQHIVFNVVTGHVTKSRTSVVQKEQELCWPFFFSGKKEN